MTTTTTNNNQLVCRNQVNGDPSAGSGNIRLTELTAAAADQSSDVSSWPVERAGPASRPRWPRARAQQVQQVQHQQLQQQQQAGGLPSPLGVVAGTKNLVLLRELDKESAEGQQAVLVRVQCLLANQQQPETTASHQQAAIIPIRLLVTDANDHAPEFVYAGQQPYVLNVSEAAPVGSIVATNRDLLAIDRDATGPHSTVHYRVDETSSPYAHLFHFQNPLESTLQLQGQLDYESLGPTIKLAIIAQDLGEPEPLSSKLELQVNVIGEFCFALRQTPFAIYWPWWA